MSLNTMRWASLWAALANYCDELRAERKEEPFMGDKTRGLYNKFRVERMDGTSKPGGKHDGCQYFVLDCDHDPHAAAALLAYAQSCETDYPLLAKDVRILATCYPVNQEVKP